MSTNLRIEVRAGDAERKQVDFTPGEPAEPFSVGSAASWVVRGDGVVGVHAYLYFDGTTLFVSSVGGAPVTMAGRSVGTDWEPVDVPMNIHVGGVKLAVRGPTSHRAGEETEQRRQPPPPEEDEKTQFQPVPNRPRQGPRGAAVAPGPAAPGAEPARFDAPPDSEATVVQRPGEQVLRAARPSVPALEALPESERTRIAPVEALAPGAAPAPVRPAAGMPPVGAPGVHPLAGTQDPTTRRAPFGPSGAPMPAAGAPPPGGMPGMAMPGAPIPGAMPGAPMPGAPMPGAPMPGAPMPGAPMPGMPMPHGGVPGFVVQPGQPPVPGAAPGGGARLQAAKQAALKLKAQAAKAWGEASIPQKAILVLLPFAFIAMFSLMGGQPQKKPAASTAKSASSVKSAAPPASAQVGTAAAGSAAPSVASVPKPVAPAAPTAAKPAAPPPANTSSKGKSQERVAVDAVAAGNYQEALKQYQALAAAHPDQAVYQKAIRILKQKIAEQ